MSNSTLQVILNVYHSTFSVAKKKEQSISKRKFQETRHCARASLPYMELHWQLLAMMEHARLLQELSKAKHAQEFSFLQEKSC